MTYSELPIARLKITLKFLGRAILIFTKNLMNGKVKTVFQACSWLSSLSEAKTNSKNELKSAASLMLTFSLPILQHYHIHFDSSVLAF